MYLKFGSKDVHLPLEGFYTFLLTFPLLLCHSLIIGYYKTVDNHRRVLHGQRTGASKAPDTKKRRTSIQYLEVVDEDEAKLERKCIRLYRISVAITVLYVTIGLILALSFVGALNEAQQRRWFFNVILFLFVGAILAAPGILGYVAYTQANAIFSRDTDLIEQLLEETCTDLCMKFECLGF